MSDLKDAVKVGKEWFIQSEPNDSAMNYWRLFRTLLKLTDELLESGKPDQCFFEYEELGKRIENDFETVSRSSIERKALARQLDVLKQSLSEHEPGLSRIAEEMGLGFIPSIEIRKGGGRSKKTEVQLIAKAIDTLQPLPSQDESSKSTMGDISYYLESIPRLPGWANWCSFIDFGSSIHKRLLWGMFVASPFFAVLLIVIHLVLISADVYFSRLWINMIFLVLPVYVAIHLLMFRHLISVSNNNISLLPDWLLPLKLNSAVLLVEIKKPDEEGYRMKSVSARVYMASCPICQHKVHLHSGGIKYWGRIIGVCDANPIEHKFSFDYTTLAGRHLL